MAHAQKNPRLDEYLTIGQAAAMLGVSASTLRNWDRQDKVRSRRHPVNGYRLYLRRDLEAILQTLKKNDGR